MHRELSPRPPNWRQRHQGEGQASIEPALARESVPYSDVVPSNDQNDLEQTMWEAEAQPQRVPYESYVVADPWPWTRNVWVRRARKCVGLIFLAVPPLAFWVTISQHLSPDWSWARLVVPVMLWYRLVQRLLA